MTTIASPHSSNETKCIDAPKIGADAIGLACRLALGEATCHDRFRFAWNAARPTAGTLGGFAKLIGVHPSSLTPTNFKLNAERRCHAAVMLAVPQGFLAAGTTAVADLPTDLRAPYHIAITILSLAMCPGQSQTATWTWEAALIGLRPTTLRAKLKDQAPYLVTAVHRYLAKHAARSLKQSTAVTLSLTEWCTIIDLLVSDSLAEVPVNSQDQRLQMACRLHRHLAKRTRSLVE